jgi:hypothetical protein
MTKRSGRLVLAALLLAALVAGAARASTLEDYHERVGEAVLILRALEATEAPPEGLEVSEAVDRLRYLLPAEEVVEVDGEAVTVDNQWLGRELDLYVVGETVEGRAERVGTMLARLEAVDLHLEALEGGSPAAQADARARVEEILRRAEFREPEESWMARLVRRTKAKVLEVLEEVVNLLFGGQRGATVSVGIRSLIIVGGVVALALLARALVKLLTRRDPERKRGERTVLGVQVGAAETAASLAAAARRLAAAGDYRGAIRKMFVALLYEFDERGLVPLEDNVTNREYLARVRTLDRLYPPVASMTDTFERVWYGGAPAGPADFDAFAAQHAEALKLAGE